MPGIEKTTQKIAHYYEGSFRKKLHIQLAKKDKKP